MHAFHHRHVVDDKVREHLIPLAQVIGLMNIKRDDVIVDVGAGNGYYTFKFAPLCAKVYALDVSYTDEEIEELTKRAFSLGLSNVEFIRADVCDGLKLANYTHLFFSNSYHDLHCQEEVLDNFKENVRVTLVEFKLDSPLGPPHFKKIGKEMLIERFTRHGFKLLGSLDFQYHYALTFQKEGGTSKTLNNGVMISP